MKKFKKILSFITALSMSASLAAPVFADTLTVSVDGADVLGSNVNPDKADGTVETLVQPEVLIFRDYEDLKEDATRWDLTTKYSFNQSGNFGTTNLGVNDGVGVEPVVVKGTDGKGLGFNTKANGQTSGGFANVTTSGYSTGKIYIAFDMQRKSDAELDEQDGTTDGFKTTVTETSEEGLTRPFAEGDVVGAENVLSDTETEIITAVDGETTTYTKVTKTSTKSTVTHDTYFYLNGGDGSTQQYGRIFTRHTKSNASPWQGTNPGVYIPDENVHRYEYILDLDNDTFKGYVDGKQVGSGTQYAADFVKFNFTLTNAIKYFDNFGIIHYPTGCENTFSLNAGEMNMTTGALTVDFDNDAVTTVDTKTFKANYPAILTEDITPENVVVKNSKGEDVAVSAVNKNVAIGSYNVVLEEALAEGETYTVSVDSDLVSALGAKIKGTTAEFKIVTPEIFLYRDYEDYTGSAANAYIIGNSNKKWGSWVSGQNQALRESSTAVEGPSGTAVNIGVATGSPNADLPYVVNSGTFYFGVDIEKENDEFFVNLDGATNVVHENFITLKDSSSYQRYSRFGTAHSACADSTTSWGGHDFVKIPNLSAGYHRYELVVDLDANKIVTYLDGEVVGTNDYTTDIKNVLFQLTQGIAKWDNLAIIHFPQGSKTQTFSLKNAKVDKEANTISVSLKSDAAGGKYKAPYSIMTEELTAEDFTVTDKDGNALNISSVTKGAAFGEYVIAVEDTLVEKATYTVATTAERTDNLGATLNAEATAKAFVAPEVYADVNFDNYSGVGTWFDEVGVTGQKPAYQQAVNDEKYGNGLDFFLPETDTWLLSALTVPFNSTINEGNIVASFDWMYNNFPGGADSRQQISVKTPSDVGQWNGSMYLIYFDKTADGKVEIKTPIAVGSWSNTETKTLEADTMYHFDLVFDYNSGKYKAFVNGEYVGGYDISSVYTATSIYFSFSVGTSFLDNVRVAYSDDDSFVINRAKWQGNYAEVLLSEAADLDSLGLADSIVVKDEAGAVVDATVEISGRRVLISGLNRAKNYTVTLPENYKSVTGNTLADNTVELECGKFNVTDVKVVADENGTALTEDMIAELKAGDKVYAEVTYVNGTGADKEFVLFGAAYSAKRMTSANYAPVTALGSVTGEAKAYVEITVDNPTEFEAKAFAVESVASMTPMF